MYFDSGNERQTIDCLTLADGSFTTSFRPDITGTWNVQARLFEDNSTYGSISPQLAAEVEEPSFLAQYSLYIGVGAGGVAVAVAVAMIYLRKWRTREVEEL